MSKIKEWAQYARYKFKRRPTEAVFTEIYHKNEWHGNESVSGPGADLKQTRILIDELNHLLRDLYISTMLDVPCGDFNWMKNVDLRGIAYTGADIVKELVWKNNDKYAADGIGFRHLDILKDRLPKADLVFCRDCFVHFSFEDIFSALNNICESQSGYLLTTTFTGRSNNRDIATGRWRVINLEIWPFELPPLKIINEGCTEQDGAYKDKALGLWKIADIKKRLKDRSSLRFK